MMDLFVSIGVGALVIGVLIYVYSKYRLDEEGYLGLKLIGYYFLGAFKFGVNSLNIPGGFLIFLLFFRPKANGKAKKIAACMGLVVFIVGVITPYVSDAYFKRTREMAASNVNLYKLEYTKDLSLLSQSLGIKTNVRIDGLRGEFENDGNIRELRFDLIEPADKGYIIYHVRLSKEDCQYMVNASRAESWLQYPNLIPARDLFQLFERMELEDMRPAGDFDFYTLNLSGYANYELKGTPIYRIRDYKAVAVSEKDRPIEGNAFVITGMEKVSESSWEGNKSVYYVFR